MKKVKLFVGSSKEAVTSGALSRLVDILERQLPESIEIVRWDKSPFWRNLKSTLYSLEEALVDFSYAVFLAFPDDEVTIRKQTYFAVRDNVLFEFGLFLSHLGAARTFLVAPLPAKVPLSGSTVRDFRIPSDLSGGFLAGSYKIRRNSPSGKKLNFDFRVEGLLKGIRALERDRRVHNRSSQAIDALKGEIARVRAALKTGQIDAYYTGTLRNATEALTRFKAVAGAKSTEEAVRDLLLYYENLPDLCDVKQLPEIQSYKRGIDEVWVLADVPVGTGNLCTAFSLAVPFRIST